MTDPMYKPLLDKVPKQIRFFYDIEKSTPMERRYFGLIWCDTLPLEMYWRTRFVETPAVYEFLYHVINHMIYQGQEHFGYDRPVAFMYRYEDSKVVVIIEKPIVKKFYTYHLTLKIKQYAET